MRSTERKKLILEAMTIMPVISTKQASVFFEDCNSPQKRTSEYLVRLAKEDCLIEGKERAIGESKIWRLTKKGRDLFGIKRRPVPLTDRNIQHLLGIGDVYFALNNLENVSRFRCELREVFFSPTLQKKLKYCPDAFFVLNGHPYFLEYQRSYLSSNGWRRKWEVHEGFLTSKEFISFLRLQSIDFDSPTIVVLSSQNKEMIRKTTKLNINIYSNINDFINENRFL